MDVVDAISQVDRDSRDQPRTPVKTDRIDVAPS
jgi:hypothetical protein